MNNDYLCKYTLITNLEFVVVNGVRTHTHALLVEEGPSMFGGGADRRIRGFGMDPAWPVFDIMGLPSIDFELTDASGGPLFISDSNPEGRPLYSGAIMQMAAGGPKIDLIVQDHEQALDIKRFEGRYGDSIITKVWDHLSATVGRFWRAPNMPRLAWGPSPGYRRGR